MALLGVRGLRWWSVLLGGANAAQAVTTALLEVFLLVPFMLRERAAVATSGGLAVARLMAMVGTARAQELTAVSVSCASGDGKDAAPSHEFARRETRVRYRHWLWWTRLSMTISVLQLICVIYLTYMMVKDLYRGGVLQAIFLGLEATDRAWRRSLVALFLVLSWLVVILQCFTGSDILRWRSFYSTQDTVWKTHYREVFDHRIREALCCLGRAKYLTVLEEDDVYSVARVVGDLLAYRASGTGHLELIAGLALLQKRSKMPTLQHDRTAAPQELIREAVILQPFAEAAYTGPLLDFGRNPVLFPCTWFYRQGFLTPWSRSRRPALQGDNWWRGHAAAFIRFAGIPPEKLLKGRVYQTDHEAAYLVVVLHEQRSIVIAIRGTETPEDLITDGLCSECALTEGDLCGLLNSDELPASTREMVISTSPHYGHGGIVKSARELLMQLDGPQGENAASETGGFLSSLLGVGCACHEYKVFAVGHSLGGSVATLLGLMLYGKYPNVRVYAYGPLPCLDSVLAEACSSFVTTIVCNDEFATRLSINSVLRLRSAAIKALSEKSPSESAMIRKLVQRILHANKYHENHNTNAMDGHNDGPRSTILLVQTDADDEAVHSADCHEEQESTLVDADVHNSREGCTDGIEPNLLEDSGDESYQALHSDEPARMIPIIDQSTSTTEHTAPYREILVEPPEMFLAGLIVHLVRQKNEVFTLKKCFSRNARPFRAFLGKREEFADIIVTPSMFRDHLPWRCRFALQQALDCEAFTDVQNTDVLVGEQSV